MGWITAIVKGIVGAIFNWWSTYRQGYQAARQKNYKAIIGKEREIRETVDKVRELAAKRRRHAEFLRRQLQRQSGDGEASGEDFK